MLYDNAEYTSYRDLNCSKGN